MTRGLVFHHDAPITCSPRGVHELGGGVSYFRKSIATVRPIGSAGHIFIRYFLDSRSLRSGEAAVPGFGVAGCLA
jgi:hypothetical protein